MAKQAASRSLDYTLDSSTLDRVARAGKVRQPKTTVGEAISEFGEDMFAEAEQLKQESDLAVATWDTGFSQLGDRGSWASGELYDQFAEMEAKYKNEYLQAVQSGDKVAMGKALQAQANRASSLNAWNELMLQANEIYTGSGFGAIITSNPENAHILGTLAKNDGSAKVRIDEATGEMVFDITMKDGTTRTVTRREVDKMVAEGVVPDERREDFYNTQDAFQQTGANGLPFERDRAMSNNLEKITPDNIVSYIDDVQFGATSFAEDFKAGNHDFGNETDYGAGELVVVDINSIPDSDGNPDSTTAEEILNYFRGKVGDEATQKAGKEAGRKEIAAYLTAKNFQSWSGGNKAYREGMEARGVDNAGQFDNL
tara:strand:- start:208 stop:1317 length:1110 start_codon:yes stop_codon:yes gene_type:complete